ncbi:MAG: hypothetical protein GY765_34260 [bacterium]|nr:hypothetical protein [bacterium]
MEAIKGEAMVPLVIPVVLAIVGYLYTYISGKRLEQRKNRLARINRQLDEFYGPLLATVKANDCAWTNFKEKYLQVDGKKRSITKNPLNRKEAWEHRNWMDTVFMPNNEALYKIITEKTSLLEGNNGIPKPLLDLATHILEARTELKKSTSNKALKIKCKYPDDKLKSYCEKEFKRLKKEQSELIKNPWYSVFRILHRF